jgi:glucan phosphorylase
VNDFTVQKLPKRIMGLNELSLNLWWSWYPEARGLFKALDRPLWKFTGHNPIQLLNKIAPHRLVAAAEDIEFLHSYDSVMKQQGLKVEIKLYILNWGKNNLLFFYGVCHS